MQRRRFVAMAFATVFASLLVVSGVRAEGKPWYERIQLRGYTQIRYNRIGASNPHLKNDQADRSIGDSGGVFIRRARLIFSGEPTSFLGFYIQPDFAGAFQDSLNFGQLRDLWADVFLDPKKMFRFRVGQQKVAFSWEMMQSSSNRVTLDRSDSTNSAVVNERDLGAFFFFETPEVRRRLRHLVDSGLKGSGDYGLTAVGLTNGQALNTRERNDNKHFFARVAYPFEIGSQTLEVAAAGYTGLYVPSRAEGFTASRREFRDFRGVATVVLFPQPFGLQVEYNVGRGPELVGKRIEDRPLDGGYLMATYRRSTPIGTFTPYVRVHRYDGGKKFETNAAHHVIRQLDAGVEWQLERWLELTTEYMEADRTVNGDRQIGRVLRLQLQFNY